MANEIFGKTIASTYKKLLFTKHDDGFEGSAAGSERVISTDDGDGSITESCLSVGTSRVGIGLTDPDYTLEVNLTGSERVKFYSGAENTPDLHFTNSAGTSSGQWKIDLQGTGYGSNVLQLGNSGHDIALMGDVGIGTTAPNVKLHVSGGDIKVASSSGTSSDAAIYLTSNLSGTERDEWRIIVDESDSQKLLFYDDINNSTRMVITQAGKVGIGNRTTTSPELSLHVYTNSDYPAKFESDDAASAIVIEDNNSTENGNRIGVVTNDMLFHTDDSEKMRILANGNIGIGTASPVGLLHMNTTSNDVGLLLRMNDASLLISRDNDLGAYVRFRPSTSTTLGIIFTNEGDTIALKILESDGSIFMPAYADGSVTFSGGTGLVTTSSDERMKKDIQTIDIDGLSKVNGLNPVTYKWRETDDIDGSDVAMYDADGTAPNGGVEMGFIAQEVGKIIPEASPDYGDNRKRGIYNRPILAVVVKAIQELSDKITALENA